MALLIGWAASDKDGTFQARNDVYRRPTIVFRFGLFIFLYSLKLQEPANTRRKSPKLALKRRKLLGLSGCLATTFVQTIRIVSRTFC